MSQIYTGFYDILNISGSSALNYVSHLYLIKDADGNLATTSDQEIIRGAAENNTFFDIAWNALLGTAGALDITVGSSTGVPDGLDYDKPLADGILDTDRNNDHIPDTYIDRGYTLVGLNGQDADTVWTALVTYATRLDAVGYDYDLLSANCVSVAASALSSVGVNITLFFPDAVFVGENNILDTNGDDTFTIFSGNGLYTFHDRSGSDTITVEKGARLQIIKDSDAASGNTVVLQQSSIEKLTVGVSYSLGVGSVPVYSNDFGVKADGNSFLGSLGSALLRVDGQYASGGRGVDVIEIRDSNNSLIKTINLAAVGKEDLGTLGLKLSDLFTAYTGHADVAGDNSADYIYGDGAANILRGERGDDVIRGGAGTDTYAFSFGDGNDTLIDDWAEGDTIALDFAVTREMISTSVSGSDLIVTIDGVGSLTIKDMAASAATFVGDHIDNVIYEATTAVPSTGPVQWGTEVFNPSTGMNELQDLNDTVTGDEFSNDHLEGRNGNDILSGLSGDDYLDGGSGSGDQLYGDAINLRVPVNDNALPARCWAAA